MCLDVGVHVVTLTGYDWPPAIFCGTPAIPFVNVT
jgi:hypothetical protein